MVLQRLVPMGNFRRMDGAMNRTWGGGRSAGYADGGRWDIPLDVVQRGDDFIVRASAPGLDASDIAVTLEDGLLTIEGETSSDGEFEDASYLLRERRFGRFRRALRLPSAVDADKATSSYDNGVLTISVPKQEAKKARRLEVNAG